MRVLLSSTAGFGHVLSMLPLALAFQRAGHAVRWATNGPAVPHVEGAGLHVVAAGAPADRLAVLQRELRPRLLDVPAPARSAATFPLLFGRWLAPEMLPDLTLEAEAWAPDLLVHEQAELAAPLVAARLGVRLVTHAFGGAVPLPILTAAHGAVASMWADAGLAVGPLAGCFVDGYLDICPPALSTVPVDHIPNRIPLRPNALRPASPGPRPPLILLTLGTVHNALPALSVALAGLAALPDPVPVVVSVGPDLDPAELGARPAHVRIERWVDQQDVVPRCCLVVAHAGSGTVLDAMAAGVPMLCLPQGADQFRNAAAVAAAGAGLSIAPAETTPAAIRSAVQRLLDDDGFARSARWMSDTVAEMPSAADVVRLLEGSAVAEPSGLA